MKEENSVQFSEINNGKYYATKYFNRSITEMVTDQNVFKNSVKENSSYAFDFKTDAVEELQYEHRASQNTKLDRIDYDADFREAFYKGDFFRSIK